MNLPARPRSNRSGSSATSATAAPGAASLAERWLRIPRRRSRPKVRLVCFPPAGSSARFYYPWQRELPAAIELVAIQYPGRDDRLNEPLTDRMEELADPLAAALAQLADVPLVLFGHSMGACVAFEAARRLADSNPGAVRHLFVSARPGPLATAPGRVHLLDDDGLISELARLRGTATTLFDDPELRAVLLPAIRTDYRLIERYRNVIGPPLTCPVTAIAASYDTEAPTQLMEGWNTCTTSTFTLHVIPGGHFYLAERRSELIGFLLTSLGLPTCSSHPSTP